MSLPLKDVITESFTQYAGAVLQSRALVDARDCLKPSARQIFYCLYTDKFTHDKPFKKTAKAVGSASRVYIHGDSSCVGVIMRAAQPFAMRYPLIEVEGSYGNLLESGNWAAQRYTSSRLAPITEALFGSIEKDTVDLWRDNYDDTEQYPSVLPSLGFYNIVNGSTGIGIALASSIPQFNINDVNNALIKLLWNKDATDDELICLPDFATGGILLNKSEVIESLKTGKGKSVKLRARIDYDEKDKCLVVTEIPYGVYTNTICGQLEELITNEPTCGISHFNDLTGETPLIKIYLNRGAKINKVLNTLYAKTSLQYYFGINLTMLDRGRTPRVFTWREALQAHLEHEKYCLRAALEYDKNKYEQRLEVVNGIIRAINIVDQVIALIRGSYSSREAHDRLVSELEFTDSQAKAILAITLSRLAHLEIEKYVEEKKKLENLIAEIVLLLTDEVKFNEKIEENLKFVAKTYGDARRTEILDLNSDEEDAPVEVTKLNVWITNRNRLMIEEGTTLLSGGRNKNRVRGLRANEFVVNYLNATNSDNLYIFTSKGNYVRLELNKIPLGSWQNLYEITSIQDSESIITVSLVLDNLVLITAKGLGKRISVAASKSKGSSIIGLNAGDEVRSVLPYCDGYLVLTTTNAYTVIIPTSEIPEYGRAASGLQLINIDEEIVAASIIPNLNANIATFTPTHCKQTSLSEFRVTKRGSKGVITHKSDGLIAALVIPNNAEKLTILTNSGIINMMVKEVPTLGRATQGKKIPYLKAGEEVIGVYL